jgi:hypothetical protein
MTHPLDDLLDEAHRALLTGDLARLGQLAPQVEDQAETPATMDGATAARLRRKADRNAQLLQAALRGLRSAKERLADIRGSTALTTYDARGNKATLATLAAVPARRV